MQKDLIKSDGIDCLIVLNKEYLLPIAYLAPIEYYSILLHNPKSVIEKHENFIKQTIRNRCVICNSNGKLLLTIPKKRPPTSKQLIKDIQISYANNWQAEHWKSIKSAYNSSPFFMFYSDEIYTVFIQKQKFLLDFNLKLQSKILKLLNIEYETNLTTSYLKETKKIDLRKYYQIINNHKQYQQVFSYKYSFEQNLSIIDLLFNLGPESKEYLNNIQI
ncbi:MAG: WbqC family protein [Bacteroidota bacterium]|nr:WbqC family protein [Bacteroidota bacterium]